eukprot:TRINITY_DN5367_c0_g1_i1.p1 TRINITY_DN5367_c0_g1~~TRINITY_DN5367_c0_g1_i1.p1  ORF type:complete len:234 (-),score=29.25 TRINITY_DN5367_c0_g1_i1:14-715(-)
MEAFANSYHKSNLSLFKSADEAYTLAFALIMLNTDAHDPKIKKKMTKEEFVKNVRPALAKDTSVSEDYLNKLYDSIVNNEIMLHSVAMKGYLFKLGRTGGAGHNWNKRWFVLQNSCLYYYQKATDARARASIPLEDMVVAKAQHDERPFCLMLSRLDGHVINSIKYTSPTKDKTERGEHSFLLLSAESEKERDKWLKLLQKHVFFSKNPFFPLPNPVKRVPGKSSTVDFNTLQ